MKRILMGMAVAVAGLALAGSVQAGGYDWYHGNWGGYPSWNYGKTYGKSYGYGYTYNGCWKNYPAGSGVGVVTTTPPAAVPAGSGVVAPGAAPAAGGPAVAAAPAAAPVAPVAPAQGR
jgi:hypothetical protein